MRRHRDAFGDAPIYRNALDVGGEYQFRVRGEDHVWTATTVSALQHAVRGNLPDQYRAYAKVTNEQSERLLTIRGLFRLNPRTRTRRKPVPIEEVEPARAIVRRFATGAMSFGSISREAHTTLAIAMNRIGGKSNTGEGGEEADRFKPLPNGDLMRSAIKQVATCLIAERIESPFGIGLKRSASSPPSPVFDLPPMRFMAIARVVWASREIEPNDMAPVEKRRTMAWPARPPRSAPACGRPRSPI